jgi:hypothetical protein
MDSQKIKREKPTHFFGKTGNLYPTSEYINHGWGGIKKGLKDLPNDEYPYTFIYKNGVGDVTF